MPIRLFRILAMVDDMAVTKWHLGLGTHSSRQNRGGLLLDTPAKVGSDRLGSHLNARLVVTFRLFDYDCTFSSVVKLVYVLMLLVMVAMDSGLFTCWISRIPSFMDI